MPASAVMRSIASTLGAVAIVLCVGAAVVWVTTLVSDRDGPSSTSPTVRPDVADPVGRAADGSESHGVSGPDADANAARRTEPRKVPRAPRVRRDLLPPPTLSGQVQDADGKPLADVELTLHVDLGSTPLTPLPGPIAGRANSDAAGRYFIEGFPRHARFLLAARAAGFAPRDVGGIEPCDEVALVRDVRLDGGAKLRGTVTFGGSPVAGARVAVYAGVSRSFHLVAEGSATTAVDGTFVIDHLAAGRKTVRAIAADLAPGGRAIVEIPARGEAGPIGIELFSGSPLEGTVKREGSDEGVGGAMVDLDVVQLESDGESVDPDLPTLTVETRSDGTFRFDHLRPGLYRLVARVEDGARSAIASAHVAREGSGSPPTEMVVIRMPRQAGLAGRVLEKATGKPITAYTAWLSASPDTNLGVPLSRLYVSSADGTFHFANVRPGRHFIVVSTDGHPLFAAGPFDVGRGELRSDIEISVPTGMLLVGRVLDDQGRPVPDATVLVHRRDPSGPKDLRVVPRSGSAETERTDDDGRFELLTSPGNVRVEVEHPDHVSLATTEFSTGVIASYEVPTIVLQRAGAMFGRVQAKDGTFDTAATVFAVFDSSEDQPPIAQAATDATGTYLLRGLRPGRWRVRLLRREGQLVLLPGGGEPPFESVEIVGGTRLRKDY